jgi:hypothetical protein
LFLFFSDVRRFLLLVLPEHQTARLKPPPKKEFKSFGLVPITITGPKGGNP